MNAKSTLIAPSTIRFERLLPGPVERVWAYLTDSSKRATWLAAGEFDLRLGGRIELICDNERLSDEIPPQDACGRNQGKVVTGTITRFEPMRALGHTWKSEGVDAEVLYELTPAGTRGKDVLLVIHHRLPDDKGLKIGVGGGWGAHTGILEDVLNGVKPRPFFATHQRLMKEFEAALSLRA
jgi:uncharacterized protein YndB with AHSA1/START domain